MDSEEALQVANEAVFSKTGKHLTDIQRIILLEACKKHTYDQIAENNGYNSQHVKNEGAELWQLLSKTLDEKVSKTNFLAALERRKRSLPALVLAPVTREDQQVKAANQYQDWGDAPDVPVFFGRTEELATLEQWILDEHCRLVAIVGMGGIGKTGLSMRLGKGGIGKTDLSLKLAQGIQDQFEYVIWRRLLNAPPVLDILADLIKFLSHQQETDYPDTLDGRISRLLYYLRVHRCLLILDNVEAILQDGERAGQYRKGYEGFGELLRRIGEIPHQSCLLLTSREKPQEIALLEGKRRPVRSLSLGGLTVLDGRKIFTEFGQFSGSQEEWKELIEFYDGNPLALEIVAKHIEEVFGGNVSNFLREGKPVFGNLTDLLDWHFKRLSDREKELMYWLAINREAVSYSVLKEDIPSLIDREKVPETLQSLQLRLPIERSPVGFTLQPVLIEYINKRLIEQVCSEFIEAKPVLLNSLALSKALTKDYIRESQCRLILKPIQDSLQHVLGSKKNIETHLNQTLSMLRQEFSSKPGYTGGNILNLLVQMQTNLNGYDFSHLTIWQAYLQNINLHNVNFAHSNLANSIFTGTFGSVLSVAFNKDGQLWATGDGNSEIHLWQLAGGSKPVSIFKGHANWIWSVAFSADGMTLASGSEDMTIKFWNIHSGECFRTLHGHKSRVWSIAFSPKDNIIASCSDDQTVRLWNVSTGQCFKILEGHTDPVESINFSPNGETIVSASSDHTIKLWNVSTGQCIQTFEGHTGRVRSVAFSPDGQTLASGGDDSMVWIWNVSTGQCYKTFSGHQNCIWSVAFSSDNRTVASSSEDQTVRLWDVLSDQCISTLQGYTGRVWSIAFSPDGTKLVTGSDNQTVKLWDICNSQCISTLQGYTNWVHSIAFSRDGCTLASSSNDHLIRLWNIDTAHCIKTLSGYTHWDSSVAFSPNNEVLACGSDDHKIRLWDTNTGQFLYTLSEHTNWVRTVIFNPTGKILASGSDDHTVKLWNVSTGQCLNTLIGHTNWVWSVVFSPDAKMLVSGGDDKTVRFWNISTGKCLNIFLEHTGRIRAVAFSNSGRTVISGGEDQVVRVWDLVSGQQIHALKGHTNWIWSVAVSSDGVTIASGGDDHIVRLWDSITGQCLNTFIGHTNRVRSVTFSPDGQILASCSEDGKIKLWNIKMGKCLKTLSPPRPYEGTIITGITGLTEAQKDTLIALGAIDE